MGTEPAPTAVRGMPQPGDTIDGKYQLVRVLGTGGMGVVFEAEHLRLKQRCAIKMLSPEMLRESDIIHRFEREARASALLKSPHVTRVTDVATTADGVPYIVMELLAGHDLDGELQLRGSVPYMEAVDYLLQACAAVGEAHGAGIIHRDLKPGNLFLAREQEGLIVKVLDFGISKMVEEESKLTSAGMTMGTALYMSPEQLRSAATVDARSDIWSLGIILYELVCGQPPFVGSAPQIAAAIVSEDAPDITKRCPIPPALGAVIHRTLRRAPAERFASVAELAAALVPFAAPDSLGAAVAAQISRRSSSRHLPLDARIEPPGGSGPDVFGDSRTILRDVSTSVSHVVNTQARHDSSSRQILIAALAVVLLVATLGAAAVAFVVFRRAPNGQGTAAGSASAAGVPSASVALPALPSAGAATSAGTAPLAASEAATAAPAPTTAPTTAPTPTAPKPVVAGAPAGVTPGVRPARPSTSAATTASSPPHPTPPVRPSPGQAATAPQFL